MLEKHNSNQEKKAKKETRVNKCEPLLNAQQNQSESSVSFSFFFFFFAGPSSHCLMSNQNNNNNNKKTRARLSFDYSAGCRSIGDTLRL